MSTYTFVSSLAEPTLASVVQRRSDAMWPDKLVDVESLTTVQSLLVLYPILNNEHLESACISTVSNVSAHMAVT
jgi:hypothetical protein